MIALAVLLHGAKAEQCCSLGAAPAPLEVSLTQPVAMERPIRILDGRGRDGNVMRTLYECDVPCEVWTRWPAEKVGDFFDLQIGSVNTAFAGGRPKHKQKIRLSAVDSMESVTNYPMLKLWRTVANATMLTSLESTVPLPYLRRSSITAWGRADVAFAARDSLEAFPGDKAVDPTTYRSETYRPRRQSKSFAEPSPSLFRNPAASFVAKNCHSKNEREELVKALDALVGVARPSRCMKSMDWPRGCNSSDLSTINHKWPCSKRRVLRRFPFYLSFENSNEVDYVTEKVYDGLEAGVLPVYLGAPNVRDFVPPKSVIEARDFSSPKQLGEHLLYLLRNHSAYMDYFRWKDHPLPQTFLDKWQFVHVHSLCRACRWTYGQKYGFPWDQRRQRPRLRSSSSSSRR